MDITLFNRIYKNITSGRLSKQLFSQLIYSDLNEIEKKEFNMWLLDNKLHNVTIDDTLKGLNDHNLLINSWNNLPKENRYDTLTDLITQGYEYPDYAAKIIYVNLSEQERSNYFTYLDEERKFPNVSEQYRNTRDPRTTEVLINDFKSDFNDISLDDILKKHPNSKSFIQTNNPMKKEKQPDSKTILDNSLYVDKIEIINSMQLEKIKSFDDKLWSKCFIYDKSKNYELAYSGPYNAIAQKVLHNNFNQLKHGEIKDGYWEEHINSESNDPPIVDKGNYVDGKKQGTWKSYEVGNLFLQAEYDKGQRHGESIIFNEDGSKSTVGHWENGKKNGVFTDYNLDGEIESISKYAEGKVVNVEKPEALIDLLSSIVNMTITKENPTDIHNRFESLISYGRQNILDIMSDMRCEFQEALNMTSKPTPELTREIDLLLTLETYVENHYHPVKTTMDGLEYVDTVVHLMENTQYGEIEELGKPEHQSTIDQLASTDKLTDDKKVIVLTLLQVDDPNKQIEKHKTNAKAFDDMVSQIVAIKNKDYTLSKKDNSNGIEM